MLAAIVNKKKYYSALQSQNRTTKKQNGSNYHNFLDAHFRVIFSHGHKTDWAVTRTDDFELLMCNRTECRYNWSLVDLSHRRAQRDDPVRCDAMRWAAFQPHSLRTQHACTPHIIRAVTRERSLRLNIKWGGRFTLIGWSVGSEALCTSSACVYTIYMHDVCWLWMDAVFVFCATLRISTCLGKHEVNIRHHRLDRKLCATHSWDIFFADGIFIVDTIGTPMT